MVDSPEFSTTLKPRGVSWKEKMAYGMGDMACASLFNFMSSYLLYFFTDVAGIAVGTAGSIISAARFADALANPAVGLAIDKTQTRWGSLRPYLLFSMVPLGLSFALVFASSFILKPYQPLYALVTYLLFSAAYTFFNIPYTALMSAITGDERDRAHLNMAKQISAAIGALVTVGLATPLIGFLGNGCEDIGFSRFGILFGSFAIGLLTICFHGTRERITAKSPKATLSSLLNTARKSRPWLLLCIAQVCLYFATNTRSAATLYYAKYYLQNSAFAGTLLSVGTFTTIFCALLFPKLVTRMRKKRIVLLGYTLFILSCLGMHLSGTNLPFIFLFNLIGYLGKSAITCLTFLMLGECIDHSEYVTGRRQQGMLTAVYMFAIKLGIVLSSLCMAFVMKIGGYRVEAVQTTRSLLSIRTNFILLPAVAALISVLVLCFYHLDETYSDIHAALQAKQQRKEDR